MERLRRAERSEKIRSLGVKIGFFGLRSEAEGLSILLKLWFLEIVFD